MYGQNNPYSQYPYTNYGYPNYGQRNYMQPQQQQMVQPQMQVQQPTMQYETPIQDIRFVTSEEAKAFIVMPNTKALLIDLKGGMAHLKSADNMGQSVAEYFKFEQVNADGTPIKAQEPTPKVDYGNFVTKDQLNGLPTAEQYQQLVVQYNTLLEQVNNMKKIIAGGKPNGNGTGTINAKQGA